MSNDPLQYTYGRMPSDDWHALEKLVGAVGILGPAREKVAQGAQARFFEELPEHLWAHEITILVKEYCETGNEELLQRAAVLLTGSSEHAWLAIWKG